MLRENAPGEEEGLRAFNEMAKLRVLPIPHDLVIILSKVKRTIYTSLQSGDMELWMCEKMCGVGYSFAHIDYEARK